MGTASWKRERNKLQAYSSRKPENTELYRIVHNFRDELQRRWELEFQHRYRAFSDEVPKVLDRYLNCGLLAHGCARAHCPESNNSELIAFSRKQRCLFKCHLIIHSKIDTRGCYNE